MKRGYLKKLKKVNFSNICNILGMSLLSILKFLGTAYISIGSCLNSLATRFRRGSVQIFKKSSQQFQDKLQFTPLRHSASQTSGYTQLRNSDL